MTSRTLILSLAMLTTWAAAGCKPAATKAPAYPPMQVAAYYWPGMYWIDIANKNGWFKEAGLEVKIVDTNPDYFGSFKDFVNGKLDVHGLSLFDVLQQIANGADLEAVVCTDYSAGADKIIARPGIESLADLKGKKVALSKGTYLQYIFEVASQREGLNPGDVQLIDVPGEKAHEELIKGTVDAITTWEPGASLGLEGVKGRILFDTSRIPGLMSGLIVFRRAFIRERPEDVRRVVRVWNRTTQFIQQNPDAAYAIVAEVNKKTPAQVRAFAATEKILDLRDNERAFSFAAGFKSLHGATRRVNDFMIGRNITQRRLDSTQFLEPSFFRELE